MSTDPRAAMLQAAAKSFEELGFLLPNQDLQDWQTSVPLEACVSVEFSGAPCGVFVLRLYGNILEAMTENMLGDDASPSKELQVDALGEMANVICGNCLPSFSGKDVSFRLGPPKVLLGSDMKFSCEPDYRESLGLESGRADLFLFIGKNPF